jgi:hypothetical protein
MMIILRCWGLYLGTRLTQNILSRPQLNLTTTVVIVTCAEAIKIKYTILNIL